MVEEYHKRILQMTNFLPKKENWGLDVTQHFITHLVPEIKQQMTADKFAYDSTTAAKDPFTQIMNLQTAYAAAVMAEHSLQLWPYFT
eukprot:8958468-Ditylum_brightwellii.AAC.1